MFALPVDLTIWLTHGMTKSGPAVATASRRIDVEKKPGESRVFLFCSLGAGLKKPPVGIHKVNGGRK
jgi:hypothetical protein